MSEETRNEPVEKLQLSWGAVSFINAPSSKILFYSVSLVLSSLVIFFVSSFFITINLTVRSSGQTDSFLGVKEVIGMRKGQIEFLKVKEGESVSANEVIGQLRIEGSNESLLMNYVGTLEKVLAVCKAGDCELPESALSFELIPDSSLKEVLAGVNKKFADYRYSKGELILKVDREINPIRRRLGLLQKKLNFLAKSKIRNYLLIQKEALDEEKGRLEQQLVTAENQLSATMREKKNEATHSLEISIFQIQDYVNKHKLKSPVAGKIAKIKRSEGSYIQEFESVVAIIPESSAIIAKVNVPGKEVAKIKEGDTAFISIDAYPVHKYGYFTGKIITLEKVASMGKDDIPLNTFVAKISIDLNSLPRKPAFALEESAPVKLEPGMGTEVRIVTGKTKLLQFMVDKVLGRIQ